MTVTRRLVGPKLPPACRRVVCVGLICVATAALLAACDDEPVPTATTQPANTPTPVATSTPPPTSTATPTPTPERRPVSEEIDALAWVKDGTTDDEKRGPVATSTPPPTATATPTPTPELTPTPTPERRPVSEEIDALAWVKDGTTDDEKRGVEILNYLAGSSRRGFWELMRKPWIRDDLTWIEVEVVAGLRGIAVYHPGTQADELIIQILGMPFLDSVEETDINAMEALSTLARIHRRTRMDGVRTAEGGG